MKSRLLYVIVFGLVLPVALMAYLSHQSKPAPDATEPTAAPEDTLSVLLSAGEQSLGWEEYLTGVVLAEMPADFHPEALKAQAVVARTFAAKRMESGRHAGAVCADPACCQGYVSAEEYLHSGGQAEAVEKVERAVSAVSGQVLTYDGALIDATYFSCSGGTTEAAVEVWGSDVPYLQSVESPGEELAEHYSDSVAFSAQELSQRLGVTLTGDPGTWFTSTTYTQGGGVDTVVIGGMRFTGKELRTLLGLRSTVFAVEVGDQIRFRTKGYGHRVGMSQYGAQAMALEGADHAAILAHYYPGTELSK